jgi:hypothetical protein
MQPLPMGMIGQPGDAHVFATCQIDVNDNEVKAAPRCLLHVIHLVSLFTKAMARGLIHGG